MYPTKPFDAMMHPKELNARDAIGFPEHHNIMNLAR